MIIIRMRFHIVDRCAGLGLSRPSLPLSRDTASNFGLIPVNVGVGLVGMNSDPLSGVSTLYRLLVFSKADL